VKATVVRAHRVLLVLATLGLAIAGSRVATDLKAVGNWLIVAGATIFLYFADWCREVDEAAALLRVRTREDRARARTDVFNARAPKGMLLLPIVALILLMAGVLLELGIL
jgi:hypothetical protein